MSKIKVFIAPVDGQEYYTTSAQDVIDNLLPELENADPQTLLQIKITEMEKSEFEAMPELVI